MAWFEYMTGWCGACCVIGDGGGPKAEDGNALATIDGMLERPGGCEIWPEDAPREP